MKKTQVAIAALALVASSAALAEGVTLYGRLDTSVAKQSGGKMSFDGSGNWDTSIWGLKGSEDLGGGLKASFQLEGGLNIGNGNIDNGGSGARTVNATAPATGYVTNTALFNRLAYVSLGSDTMGTVALGHQFSPYVGAALGGVATNNESFYVPLLILAGGRSAQPFGAGGAAGASTGGFFIPNALSYATPNIGGFSAKVLTSVSAGVDDDKYTAGSASFAMDALTVNFGAHKRGDAASTTGNYYAGQSITAAYALGNGLRVTGGYHRNDNKLTNTKVNSYNVGAAYNVTEATQLSLQYARNNEADAASIVNVGLLHNLSKRTYAYATVSRAQNGASTTYSLRSVGGTADATGYAVGIGHNF